MSAVGASPREQILALAERMTISDEKFAAINAKLDTKLAERVIVAKDPSLQPELNRIFTVYKSAIERHKINLKVQYDAGRQMVKCVTEMENLSNVSAIMLVFQITMLPLLETHKKLEAEMQDLEEKIVPLLPADTKLFV